MSSIDAISDVTARMRLSSSPQLWLLLLPLLLLLLPLQLCVLSMPEVAFRGQRWPLDWPSMLGCYLHHDHLQLNMPGAVCHE